jgi:ectoine hydroxylase-related dioxygenase (phytanoyl-CoA dioxygenase family)
MKTTSIPVLSVDDGPARRAAALDEAGCLVVTGVIDQTLRTAVVDELAPHMEAARVIEADDPAEFYPGRTRRVTGLVARSPAVRELIRHPQSTSMCDHFLLPNSEFGYQLHVTAALSIGPGARAQVLHREEDSFTYFPLPRPNLIVATMWAISEFRVDNGATLVVPGSHRWPSDRVARPDEVVSAVMPAGSVFFWLGGTLHGGGANVSTDWRYGIILTYSLGWLRQEENQYLDVPPRVLDELTPDLKKLAGFEMYRALGLRDRRLQ